MKKINTSKQLADQLIYTQENEQAKCITIYS